MKYIRIGNNFYEARKWRENLQKVVQGGGFK